MVALTVAKSATKIAQGSSSQVDVGLPIENLNDAIRAAEKIRAGCALLQVVEMPWGVEFYLCEEGENP